MSCARADAGLENEIIRASAGTGKTFQLTNRYLGLLCRGVPAEQILATTFTRKAAGEILDRVIVRLADAALDAPACRELGEFLGMQALDQDVCLDALHHLLRHLHRLRISTLDSFFAHLARSFSLELGLPPGWRILEPVEEATLRDEAIAAVLRGEGTSNLLNLTHLLTKGEARRGVSELVRSTVQDVHAVYEESEANAWTQIPRPSPLDGLQLQSAIQRLRDVPVTDARCAKARDTDCEQALEGDWEAFIAGGLAGKILAGDNSYYRRPLPEELVDVYGPLIAHARAVLVGRVAMQTEGAYQLLRRYDLEFRRVRSMQGVLRFADVTGELAAGLTAARPQSTAGDTGGAGAPNAGFATGESEAFAFRMDGHVQHVLLDEFQDTAPVQWRVLRPFAEYVTQPGTHRSFLCVGDVKQAIYGWRGGVAEIFDAVARHLPGLKHQALNKSFRSCPPVIDTVNRVFPGLLQHPHLDRAAAAVEAWRAKFQPHATQRVDLAGVVSLRTAGTLEKMAGDPEPTLQAAAQQVVELARQRPDHTVGILVRRNETVGKLIYAIRRLGLDASEEGGNPLTDSLAVQLVLSLLRLADHPGDTVARFHVAHSPLATLVKCGDWQDSTVAQAVSLRVRRSLLETGYGPTIAAWAEALRSSCSGRERSRLDQLVEMSYRYQSRATLRAVDFVRLVRKQRVSDPTSARVRVMTVHQAKGLEFDIVVLPELDLQLTGQPDSFVVHRDDPTAPVRTVCRYVNEDVQRLLPAKIQQIFAEVTHRWIAESLCVLYVAMTRAVHELRMIIAPAAANERKLPRTYAGLLRAALTDPGSAPANTILYEHGDSRWHERGRLEAVVAGEQGQTQAASPPVVEVQLAPLDGRRRRGLERVRPSGLEGGERVRIASLLRTSNRVALLRGTLIHSWFEQVTWLDDGRPPADLLRRVAAEQLRATEGVRVDLNALIDEFSAMLELPAVNAALHRSAYDSLAALGIDTAGVRPAPPDLRLTVEAERSFAIRQENQVVTGSIDRLVLIHDGPQLVAADIIDFKSDALAASDRAELAARTDFYRPQLHAYRRAVAKLTGLAEPCIAARLAFVAAGVVEPVG